MRPKGLGLGADKMAVSNPVSYCSTSSADKEGLSLANGAPTQVVAGAQKGMYGKIVSHNEDTGRCIIKLEIGGSTVSVNENFLKPVTKEEYSQNARVLNAAKFNKYKESDGSIKKEKEYSRSSHRSSPEMKRKEEKHSDFRRRRERSRSPVK
ncbi:hypothetical protein J437_LFUL003879 [Ladona fulva]|uniref:Uncharacterized protein n=1 Tax=Ladona fulva TaxID=123851 RepID=A0A8K0K4V8_LADFU|nr:hypothetical protein J437_LFUL003879 [Ladona fulva]